MYFTRRKRGKNPTRLIAPAVDSDKMAQSGSKCNSKVLQSDSKPNAVTPAPPVPSTMLLIIQLMKHPNINVEACLNAGKH